MGLLEEGMVLRLCTVGSRPHVVPVWYLYEGGRIHIGTNTRTAKVKNIRKNPAVALCVDEGVRSPIRGVMWQGTAKIVEGERVRETAARILERYFGSVSEKEAQELLDDTDCIIEVVPEKTAGWQY